MAHVEKRQQARRDGSAGPVRWRVRYRTPAGQPRTRTFARKIDADRYAAVVETDKLRGSWVDPSAGRVTFGEYAEQWQAMQVHRATTSEQVASHLRNHVMPAFGARPLAGIRPSEIQAWVKGRSLVLAPSTLEVVYRYLVAIFRAAVADRRIPESPCQGVKLPRSVAQQVAPLEVEQVAALVEAMPERHRALVVLAVGTGLRQGEAFGLALDRVDFLRRTLRVDQQVVLLADGPRLAPPRTDASYRVVPLPDVVLNALATHLAAYPVAHEHQLLFTNDRGELIRRNRFGESVWTPAVRRAGLPKGTGFHDLRHFYASLLIRHGESVKVVQARLGHKTAQETLDTYGHLWPDSDDRTRAAVDAVLGAAPAPESEAK